MMPKQVLVSMLLEVSLILFTTILLTQPRFLFFNLSLRTRAALRASGWAMLCITFCFSVIFGCILALNATTISL
jgi:hypothetical protein